MNQTKNSGAQSATNKASEGAARMAVEFSGAVLFRAIKTPEGEFFAEGQDIVCEGKALSITADGAVVDTADLMPEGTIVAVDLELSSSSLAQNILAKIQRVDQVDGAMILGLTFLNFNDLKDQLGVAELELLDKRFVDIKRSVGNAISSGSGAKEVSR